MKLFSTWNRYNRSYSSDLFAIRRQNVKTLKMLLSIMLFPGIVKGNLWLTTDLSWNTSKVTLFTHLPLYCSLKTYPYLMTPPRLVSTSPQNGAIVGVLAMGNGYGVYDDTPRLKVSRPFVPTYKIPKKHG